MTRMDLYLKKLLIAVLFLIASSVYGQNYWGPAMTLSSVNQTTQFPIALGANNNGDAIGAWFDGTNVVTATLPFNSTSWSSPTIVSSAANVDQIVVTLDINNNAAISWVENQKSGAAKVFMSYSSSGGSWQTPVQPVPASFSASNLFITIDDNGGAVVGWIGGNDSTGPGGFFLYFYLSGNWQTDPSFPGNIGGTYPAGIVGPSYPPFLTSNGNGDIMAFWINSSFDFYYSSRINGIWAPPVPVLFDTNYGKISSSLKNSQNAVIVYNEFNSHDIYGQIINIPYSLLSSTTLQTLSLPAGTIKTCLDAQGNAAATWTEFGITPHLFGTYYNALTGTWSPVETIDSNVQASNYTGNALILDTNGNSVSVYFKTDSFSYFKIQSSNSSKGSSWTTPVLLSTNGIRAFNPCAVTTQRGLSIAIWEELGVASSTIKFALNYGGTGSVSNLSGKTLLNRFATQANLFQELTWSPSLSSDTVGYNIYRGTTLKNPIGTVPASGPFKFIIDGVPIRQSTTYTVIPVSSSGALGIPETITLPAYRN